MTKLAAHEDCLRLIETTGLRRFLIGALAAAAAIAAAEERFAPAARLLGAVERVADDLGARPTLTESGDLGPATAETRDALGDEAFAAAVAEGRRLSDEEAIRVALTRATGA